MITRPLDLASKLRPPPRNLDGLFYVNAGLLVLFFALFGSRFVLAPGFGVDIRLPVVAGADANANTATHVIDVDRSGQIFTPDGRRSMKEVEEWLVRAGKTTKEPRLLLRADGELASRDLAEISMAAKRAGFDVIWAAIDDAGQKGR